MKKKGRPTIDPARRRSTLLRVLVTEEELRAVQRSAREDGVGLSEWVRGVLARRMGSPLTWSDLDALGEIAKLREAARGVGDAEFMRRFDARAVEALRASLSPAGRELLGLTPGESAEVAP